MLVGGGNRKEPEFFSVMIMINVTNDSKDFMHEGINELYNINHLLDDFLIHDLFSFWFYFVLTSQTFPAFNELQTLLYRLNVTNYDE